MSRARSLSPEEREHLGAAVDALVAEYGTQGAVAKALRMPDGGTVSAQTVSMARARHHIGLTFARAVALKLGIPVEHLLRGVREPGPSVPPQRYKDLPGWAEAAATVITAQMLPHYAVTAAGETLVSFPVEAVDARLVFDQGNLWLRHAPRDVRAALEKADILAAREAREAREDDLYGALQESEELAKERGSVVSPVPALRAAQPAARLR